MFSACSLGSRGSVLGVVTRLRVPRSGVRMSVGARDFPLLQKSLANLGPNQPSIQLLPGAFSGVKRPGFEGNYVTPCIGEVKNEWNCTTSPPIRVHFMDSDTVTFTFHCFG
jgi:hypothetical protein